MTRKALFVLIPAMLIAATALGGTQTLVLKSGPKYTGDVTKTNAGYQITLPSGDRIEYSKDQVKSVTPAADPTDEYNARLAKIDATKPDGHFDIGKWAQAGGYLDIAYKEYGEAYKLDPNSERIKTRLQQVTDLIEELTKAGTKGEGTVTTTKPEEGVPGQTIMSDQDIFRIRMYELTADELKQSPPVIEWKGKVPEEFIKMMRERGDEKFAQDRARVDFLGLSKPRQLQIMRKELQDNDKLFDSILIKTDPRFMRDFRSQVWKAVVRTSCASVDCHGSVKGKGGLQLLNGKTDRVDYQNFLILSRWSNGGRNLIDRGEPGDSLLLQYGLPAKLAKQGLQHPNVPQRPAPFRGTRDQGYVAIENWIKTLKGPGTPNYRTEWKPAIGAERMAGEGNWLHDVPSSGPATKPAEGKGEAPADPFEK